MGQLSRELLILGFFVLTVYMFCLTGIRLFLDVDLHWRYSHITWWAHA